MSLLSDLAFCITVGLASFGEAQANAAIEEFRSRCVFPLEEGKTIDVSNLNVLGPDAFDKDPILDRALNGSRLYSFDENPFIFGVADPRMGVGCFVLSFGSLDETVSNFFEWASSLVAEGKHVWSRPPPIVMSPTDNVPLLLSQPPLDSVRMGLLPDPNRNWVILLADTVGR